MKNQHLRLPVCVAAVFIVYEDERTIHVWCCGVKPRLLQDQDIAGQQITCTIQNHGANIAAVSTG
jgi:hypothetical protein